jgi:hypothetical protein
MKFLTWHNTSGKEMVEKCCHFNPIRPDDHNPIAEGQGGQGNYPHISKLWKPKIMTLHQVLQLYTGLQQI